MKFVHIPKTGGISICRALGHKVIGHVVYDRDYSEFSFCVFRDPVERFISAYNHLKYNQINKLDRSNCEEYIGDKNIHQFIKSGFEIAVKEQQHFLPQVHWIPFGVDRIICFKHLREQFSELFPGKRLQQFNVSPKGEIDLSEDEKYFIRKVYNLDNIIYAGSVRKHNMLESAKAGR